MKLFVMILFHFILGIFCRLDRALRPGSNVQKIPGIFQKLLHISAAVIGRIFNGIFLCMQLFVSFCSISLWNILGIFCRLDRALRVKLTSAGQSMSNSCY